MKVGYEPKIPGAVVGDDLLPEGSRENADLTHRGDAFEDEGLGLQDVVNLILQHVAEFVQAGVVFRRRQSAIPRAASGQPTGRRQNGAAALPATCIRVSAAPGRFLQRVENPNARRAAKARRTAPGWRPP